MEGLTINTPSLWILTDRDGDIIGTWSEKPSDTTVASAIKDYDFPNMSPHILALSTRREVWEWQCADGEQRAEAYKVFDEENVTIVPEVVRGKRKVILR